MQAVCTIETSIYKTREVQLTQSDWLHKLSLVYYKPNTAMEMHAHQLPEASILLAGNGIETARRERDITLHHRLRMKPELYRHQVRFGPQGALFLAIKYKGLQPGDSQSLGLKEEAECATRQTRPWLNSLVQALRNETVDEAGIEQSLTELTVESFVAVQNRYKIPPTWLMRVRERLMETSDSVTDIAKDEGVHRVYLARVFQAHFQQSMSACRKQARIDNGVQAILARQDSIGGIAHAAGFADQSHMTREFTKGLGLSPRQLDKILR